MTPWTTARQAPLSFTISQSLLQFMSLELVAVSDHLIFCCPLLLLPSSFPSIRVFSSEFAVRIRWPKYWSFSISPSSEYSGLISFRMTDLISLQSTGLSRVFFNTTVQKYQFFGAQPSLWSITSIHDSWKPLALIILSFVGRVMFLMFNMLSRIVLGFLPRSKRLLIIMASITVRSDFGTQENIVCHCFYFFPFY